MAERMKPGIKWQPESLQRETFGPLADEVVGMRKGYVWAVDETGELIWAEIGTIGALSAGARKRIKQWPSAIIRVVQADRAGQAFFLLAADSYQQTPCEELNLFQECVTF
ncbi:MAG: hypothetical protein Q7R82_00920 [Candidatus Daviesbacteria bacterium]|nr:hypothetical protein [Candidatus Daviesbacteria bacterium]